MLRPPRRVRSRRIDVHGVGLAREQQAAPPTTRPLNFGAGPCARGELRRTAAPRFALRSTLTSIRPDSGSATPSRAKALLCLCLNTRLIVASNTKPGLGAAPRRTRPVGDGATKWTQVHLGRIPQKHRWLHVGDRRSVRGSTVEGGGHATPRRTAPREAPHGVDDGGANVRLAEARSRPALRHLHEATPKPPLPRRGARRSRRRSRSRGLREGRLRCDYVSPA